MGDHRITDDQAKKMEAIVEEETKRLSKGLEGLLEDARGEDGPAKVSATKRLKIFGSVSDPVLATKLALFSHDERRRYLARQKAARGKLSARRKGGKPKPPKRKR